MPLFTNRLVQATTKKYVVGYKVYLLGDANICSYKYTIINHPGSSLHLILLHLSPYNVFIVYSGLLLYFCSIVLLVFGCDFALKQQIIGCPSFFHYYNIFLLLRRVLISLQKRLERGGG